MTLERRAVRPDELVEGRVAQRRPMYGSRGLHFGLTLRSRSIPDCPISVGAEGVAPRGGGEYLERGIFARGAQGSTAEHVPITVNALGPHGLRHRSRSTPHRKPWTTSATRPKPRTPGTARRTKR